MQFHTRVSMEAILQMLGVTVLANNFPQQAVVVQLHPFYGESGRLEFIDVFFLDTPEEAALPVEDLLRVVREKYVDRVSRLDLCGNMEAELPLDEFEQYVTANKLRDLSFDELLVYCQKIMSKKRSLDEKVRVNSEGGSA